MGKCHRSKTKGKIVAELYGITKKSTKIGMDLWGLFQNIIMLPSITWWALLDYSLCLLVWCIWYTNSVQFCWILVYTFMFRQGNMLLCLDQVDPDMAKAPDKLGSALFNLNFFRDNNFHSLKQLPRHTLQFPISKCHVHFCGVSLAPRLTPFTDFFYYCMSIIGFSEDTDISYTTLSKFLLNISHSIKVVTYIFAQ